MASTESLTQDGKTLKKLMASPATVFVFADKVVCCVSASLLTGSSRASPRACLLHHFYIRSSLIELRFGFLADLNDMAATCSMFGKTVPSSSRRSLATGGCDSGVLGTNSHTPADEAGNHVSLDDEETVPRLQPATETESLPFSLLMAKRT